MHDGVDPFTRRRTIAKSVCFLKALGMAYSPAKIECDHCRSMNMQCANKLQSTLDLCHRCFPSEDKRCVVNRWSCSSDRPATGASLLGHPTATVLKLLAILASLGSHQQRMYVHWLAMVAFDLNRIEGSQENGHAFKQTCFSLSEHVKANCLTLRRKSRETPWETDHVVTR